MHEKPLKLPSDAKKMHTYRRFYIDSNDLPRSDPAGARVYIVSVSAAGPVKVGIAKDPQRRVRSLEGSAGVRFQRIWLSAPQLRARDLEALAHRSLHEHRSVGEWFNIRFEEAMQVLLGLSSGRRSRRRLVVLASAGRPAIPSGDDPMDTAARAALPLLMAFLADERG